MYPDITIEKNSQFFVALCKDTDSPHSFITLGVIKNNQHLLLGAYGKILHKKHITNRRFMACQLFFGQQLPSLIINEKLIYDGMNSNAKTFSYKAYSINYTHYLEFLQYLTHLSHAQSDDYELKAYCPQSKVDGSVTLQWRTLEKEVNQMESRPTDFREHEHLNITNTCRHSAISMTKKISHLDDLGEGVSSLYLKSPPLQTSTYNGVMAPNNEYIYILPLPPQSFGGLSKETVTIISKLYQRLDHLLTTERDNSELTAQKFKEIKSLYESLTAGHLASLSAVFNEINEWATKNKTLIASHRKWHWISFRTATQKMVDDLLASQPSESKESPAFEENIQLC